MKSNILSLFAGLGIWAGLLTSPAVLYAQEDMSAYDIDMDVKASDVEKSSSSTRFEYVEFASEDSSFTDTTGYVTGDGFMRAYGRSTNVQSEIYFKVEGYNVWPGTYDVYVVMVPQYYLTGEVPAEGATVEKNKFTMMLDFLTSTTATESTTVTSDAIDYDGTKVDTILALQDITLPVTYYKGNSGVYPTISFKSDRLSASDRRNGYTNVMCIDRLILKAKDVTPGQAVIDGSFVSGRNGETSSYSLDTQTGTLTLSGEGDLYYLPEVEGFPSSKLRSIVLGEGFTGFYPGVSLSGLVSVSLPSTLKDFGNTFQNSSITSLTVPASVERISDFAFFRSDLTSIAFLGNAVKTIGEYAFARTPLAAIELPGSVESIGNYAFDGGKLASITFSGNALKTIGEGAFGNTLLTAIELPSGVETIGDYAFANTKLAHVEIPEGTKSIGRLAFACTNTEHDCHDEELRNEHLASITLPASLESIGDSAFYKSLLTEVELPSGLKTLGGDLFAETPLHKVTWDARSAEDVGDDAATYPFYSVRYSVDTFYIGSNVEHLPAGLCRDMNIREIALPNNLKSIGARCFEFCSFKDGLAIPASVTSIGERAYVGEYDVDEANAAYCDVDGVLFSKDKTELLCYPHYQYASYSIPEGVNKVSTWAFYSMPRVDIPASVRELSLDVFANTRLLTTKWKTAAELPTLLPSESDAYFFTVQIPYGSMDAYKQADGWKNSSLVYEHLVGNALADKPTFSLFQQMMQATGWDKELMKVEDEEYARLYLNGEIEAVRMHSAYSGEVHAPRHRYYGYTVFAEKNSVFETLLGKSADAISLQDLTAYLATHYEGKTDDDYTAADHVLNRFVSYHLLPVKLAENQLVIHYNELWYNPNGDGESRVPVMEYRETMGEGRRLMKMSESKESRGVYINRFMKTDRQTGAEITGSGIEGIAINKEDSENASYLNGYVYALDELLVYSPEVRSRLGSERMRHDVAALLPELTNNNLRCTERTVVKCLVPTTDYPYLENLTLNEGAFLSYLSPYNECWQNYQGDELNTIGNTDITIKLPAVPEDGTYELRIPIQFNTERGICQAYMGTDKDNLQPCGLPIDMRGGYHRGGIVELLYDPAGWIADTGDEVRDRLNDLSMREKGYMKGIKSHYVHGRTTTIRDNNRCLRKIIGQFHMEAGETYYLRLKSLLRESSQNFYLDFIELVPEKVYNNPAEPEDQW